MSRRARKVTYSHWAVGIKKDFKTTTQQQRNQQYRAAKLKIEPLGYQMTTYFHFRDDDNQAEAKAKAAATALAAEIQSRSGVEMEVYEGCFI